MEFPGFLESFVGRFSSIFCIGGAKLTAHLSRDFFLRFDDLAFSNFLASIASLDGLDIILKIVDVCKFAGFSYPPWLAKCWVNKIKNIVKDFFVENSGSLSLNGDSFRCP